MAEEMIGQVWGLESPSWQRKTGKGGKDLLRHYQWRLNGLQD